MWLKKQHAASKIAMLTPQWARDAIARLRSGRLDLAELALVHVLLHPILNWFLVAPWILSGTIAAVTALDLVLEVVDQLLHVRLGARHVVRLTHQQHVLARRALARNDTANLVAVRHVAQLAALL